MEGEVFIVGINLIRGFRILFPAFSLQFKVKYLLKRKAKYLEDILK